MKTYGLIAMHKQEQLKGPLFFLAHFEEEYNGTGQASAV